MNLAPRPRQRLRQNGADRAIVIGNKYSAIHLSNFLHFGPIQPSSFGASGKERRNTVLPGTESTAIQPP